MALPKGKGVKSVFWLLICFCTLMVSSCGGDKKPEKSPPVAVIQLAETRGVAPFKVYLRANGSYSPEGEIKNYTWSFPDGSTQSGANVSYTFLTVGTHGVDLTVENDSGLVNSSSVSITVVGDNDRFSIQGVISSLAFTDTDSDVNDPNADYASNDGDKPENVQQISNPIEVSGFASGIPTFWRGDRFASVADEQDHYKVHLEAKDFVSLFIADYNNADLDLYVYEESTMNMVAYSNDPGEYESIQVSSEGDYVVVVEAVEGFTNYVLKVGRSSLANSFSTLGNSADFAENQVVIKMEEGDDETESTTTYVDEAQIGLSHRHKHRAMLGRINPLNPQTHNMLWGGMNEVDFQRRLSFLNPLSASKLKTLKAIKRLSKQKGIKVAEPNYRVKGLLTPNDSYFVYQWHLESLHMRQAWDISSGDPDVIIAVVDTGVYLQHPDLKNQLVSGYDFVSDPTVSNDGDGIDPDPTDPGDSDSLGFSSWHGTHVTGIAVAQINNNLGVVGVAPNAKVMPVRAIGMDGGLMYDVLQAVRYSAGLENDSNTVPDRIADVINLSLGGEGYSSVPQELFREVREKGIIVVASSGNQNTGVLMYPASYDGVISVGAATRTGARASYSNTGPSLDIMAYGGNNSEDRDNDGYQDGILSTMVFEANGLVDPDYSLADGTSMASPQVSAIVALMKSVYPELTPDLFDSLLFSGKITQDKGDPGRDNDYGYGLVDGLKAVQAAQSLQDGATTSAIAASSNIMLFDMSITEKILEIKALGNGAISIVSATSSEDWLSISDENIDLSGLGSYRVATEIDGFASGNYRAHIDIVTDQDTSIRIEVVLRIGNVAEVGNAGFLYILLVNADNGDLAASNELASTDGFYSYSFENIPVGHYYVTAGSDVDNNGLVCEYGETCGMYPAIDSFEIFHLVGDITQLNFDAGLYSSSELFGIQSLFSSQSRLSSK